MNTTLVPYYPAHPKAPISEIGLKGILLNKCTKKVEVKYTNNHKGAHNQFHAEHKECTLSNIELTKLLKTFNENMVQAALTCRGGVLIPNRMGKLQVVMGTRTKTKVIDKFTSVKLGFEVSYTKLRNKEKYPVANIDVYGDSYNMHNKYLWDFKADKAFRKAQQEIVSVDRTRFVGAKKVFVEHCRKERFYKKEFVKAQNAELLLTYNEFEGIV